MADSSVSVKASCMCGAHSHTFNVPKSQLPLASSMCSCTTCRRISGALCAPYALFPTEGNTLPDFSNLEGYKTSDKWTRYFCPKCGTHLYSKETDSDICVVATGSLDKEDGIIEFTEHIWLEDTKDGGIGEMLSEVNGKKLRRWAQDADGKELPDGWTSPDLQTSAKDNDTLLASCHCNGGNIHVSRPKNNADGSKNDRANPSNEPWWNPREGKFLAGTCACTSCRTSSGFDITFWSFVPVAHISVAATGAAFSRDGYWGTLKSYRSSPDVTRVFCGTCGATFFWDGDERPLLVDLAIGLLDAPNGALAKDWLYWRTTRVSFTEDASNRNLFTGLEKGLKTWGEKLKAEGNRTL